MRKFVRNQITFLLFGFAFWLPVGVLIFIIALLFSNVEEIGRKILLLFLPEKLLYSGFGIVLGILIVYCSGIVLKLTKVGRVFSKIPVLGLFFGAGEIITIDRLLHLKPCLFLLSPTCLSYGWILSEEKVKLSEEKAIFSLVNVYYPNVPTLVTGQVFPVRKDSIIRLGNSSKEIIDLLLYAFRSPTDLKYLPWEDESPEDFEKRAKSFGLDLNTE
ncbi:MAG: hypothetical protein OEZ07_00665 [Dehalococcoidia bacterium]|nr:hypothetical protein [Dehalococcoidia bacterium]MDH5781067.1 hypothetical protein [Dehalococcoidia bacterium]